MSFAQNQIIFSVKRAEAKMTVLWRLDMSTMTGSIESMIARGCRSQASAKRSFEKLTVYTTMAGGGKRLQRK